MSKFRNAGQTCVCANRILVEDAIYDAFSKKLADAVAKLKVGPGDQEGVEIGPLIDEKAIEKVERMVAEALASGATALTGGKKHPAGAQFYTPTVLANVTRDMRVNTEEIFGPVAPLIRFKTEDEAVVHRQRHAVRPRLLLLHQATSTAPGAWPSASRAAWSRSMTASSPTKSSRSAAGSRAAWAAKAASRGWRNISRPSS